MNKGIVLNKILLGSLALSYAASVLSTAGYLLNTHFFQRAHQGIKPYWIITLAGIFTLIHVLSKKSPTLAGILLTLIFLLSGIANSILWGADVPISYLIYILTITVAGVVIGPKYAFIVATFSGLSVLIIASLQHNGILDYDGYWLSNPPTTVDGIIATIFFSIIAIVSWLSNREIEHSLRRAESSEAALKLERDSLEVRVQERTRDLQKAQLEKMLQLHRFADLGKLASGLIHELINPLTVVSLNLDHMSSQTKHLKNAQDDPQLRTTLKRAVAATQHIEKYVIAAQRQIQQQSVTTRFSIHKELKQLMHIFSYRSKKERVTLNLKCPKDLYVTNNPIKFNQLMSILISNAFDAYDTTNPQVNQTRNVDITVKHDEQYIAINITDFGKGIPKNMHKKIFEPFFTTKQYTKGTGIGLSIAQDIAKESFNGTLELISSRGHGTTFTVKIPFSSVAS